MTRVLISNRLHRDFSMVPDALWRSDLPFAAKGVACYLLSLRHGAMPYVAEMEAALGMGRDARRKAFAALEAFGFLSWRVERNSSRRIVAKTLEIDPLCFDLAEGLRDAAARAPESQAHGEMPVPECRAPEKPAGGNPVPAGAESRPCRDGVSGDTLKDKRIKGAASARAVVGQRPRPVMRSAVPLPDVAVLPSFVRSCILSGKSVTVGGVLIRPGSPEAQAMQQALRLQDAENGARSC